MPVSPQTALTETIKVLITAILTDCITLSRTSGTVIVVRMDIITQDLLIMGDVQAITGNALIAQMIGMCCSHMGLVCCQSILGRRLAWVMTVCHLSLHLLVYCMSVPP